MIVDKLSNANLYFGLGERFKKAFEYLNSTDLLRLEPGKYPIDGNDVVVNVNEYNTKEAEEAKPEAHRVFFDIQVVVTGAEFIGYASLANQPETDAYDTEKDLIFYSADVDKVKVSEGMFAIYGPDDIHAPGIKIGNSAPVKKIVVKVKK